MSMVLVWAILVPPAPSDSVTETVRGRSDGVADKLRNVMLLSSFCTAALLALAFSVTVSVVVPPNVPMRTPS